MCKAFSCIVTDQGDVRWKMGIDSHSALLTHFHIPDTTANKKEIRFAKIEITPANNDYLKPDKWVFRLDEDVAPDWWNAADEQLARAAHKKWYRAIRRMLVNKPVVHPFNDRNPKKITHGHLALLKSWASVWASARASVGESVWASVGDSVWASVWDSAWASLWTSASDSVRASARASVRAYVGSRFRLPRKAWKYTEGIKTKAYPFQPCVDLWEAGLVPSFDGKQWRLRGGKNAAILWEGTLDQT